jgi:hypothetical protein
MASNTPVRFRLTNTGGAAAGGDDAEAAFGSDIYRLSVSIEGEGWSARLLNALAAVEAGGTEEVTVYVTAPVAGVSEATVTLVATSESDPSKTSTASVVVAR